MCGDGDKNNDKPGVGATVPLGFVGGRFSAATHICCLYNDDEERQRVSAGFVRSGLAAGECVGCYRDALSAHPIALVRGQVVRNPYDVPPDRFIDAGVGR